MDRRSIDALRDYGGAEGLPAGTQALLMVEADGDAEDVPRQLAALEATLGGEGLIEVQSGFDKAEIARLWTARKSLSHAVKEIAPLKINEDVVVPVARLAELVHAIDDLGHQHDLPLVAFGHAGNGNLHVNLMVDPDDADEMARARACRRELVATVLRLDGSLSGEHGIGSEKRQFVGLEIDPDTLGFMRDLKALFDPHGILNPGKKLPDA
jgi:D-lactate dehydrogenase